MSFFQSPVVRAEMAEISELQEEVYTNIFKFPSMKKEDQEIINDLIIAAYNNAKERLKKKSAEELSKVTGGLNLPSDFKLPF